jgi:hypothetical protein
MPVSICRAAIRCFCLYASEQGVSAYELIASPSNIADELSRDSLFTELLTETEQHQLQFAGDGPQTLIISRKFGL